MAERKQWREARDARMAEPGAEEAYEVARMADELGRAVRGLREGAGWTQGELANAAGMTQSAIARFEAGGTVPALVVLERLASALHATLTVNVTPRSHFA
jgi:ribosome-binding protein aMBF1 (putative translation factor)